jgi:hypothetical protein
MAVSTQQHERDEDPQDGSAGTTQPVLDGDHNHHDDDPDDQT